MAPPLQKEMINESSTEPGINRKEISSHSLDWQWSWRNESILTPASYIAPCRGCQLEGQLAGEGDPPYPSIFDALREDRLHSVSDACCVGQISCEYPKDSVVPAVVENKCAQRPMVAGSCHAATSASSTRTRDLSVSGDPFMGQKCPPLHPAMQDTSTSHVLEPLSPCKCSLTHCCLGRATKSVASSSFTDQCQDKSWQPYPPLLQAVRDNSGPFTEHLTNLFNQDVNNLQPTDHILLSCKKLNDIQRLSLHDNLEKSFELQDEVLHHLQLSCRVTPSSSIS